MQSAPVAVCFLFYLLPVSLRRCNPVAKTFYLVGSVLKLSHNCLLIECGMMTALSRASCQSLGLAIPCGAVGCCMTECQIGRPKRHVVIMTTLRNKLGNIKQAQLVGL